MTRIATLSNTDIARHAVRGRQLQARAVRDGFAAVARFVLAAVTAGITRRAFARRIAGRRDGVGVGCGAHA